MNPKFTTLSSLCINGGSYGIPASAVNFSNALPTYLRITDINDDGTINFSGLKSVDHPDAGKYLLLPNDIVFARTGASTGRNYFYDGRDGSFVYAGFLIKFSIDPDKVNPRFIKYYCQSRAYYDWVNSFNSGSTRGNINAVTLGNMPVPEIARDLQDFIVQALTPLDDKIELNARIIGNLEAQAQAIFKSWFVDFEPFQDGEFEDSDLGLIPKGWRVDDLLGIADYLNGLAMQNYRPDGFDDGLPVLKIKELRQGFCDASSDRCTSLLESKYVVHDGDVIFSWSGSLMIDLWCSGDSGLNQHLFKVTSNQYKKWFYFLWTKHHLDEFILIAADKATTMGHIKREALEKALLVVPDQQILDEADRIFEPLIDSIILKRVENRKLAIVRDTLLPKLMSGEIEVPVEG